MTETVTTNAMLEIRIQCPPILASYLEELLWTVRGVESVGEAYRTDSPSETVEPSDLAYITVLTRDPLGEDWIKVMFVENPKLMKVCDIIGTRWIEEKDWAESWKQYWKPTHVSETLTVCPTWEDYSPQRPDEIVLRLDPECAFGTGTHETTQLMLKALENLSKEIDFSQINMLDVGTGSGILAVYAAKLGCRDVRGVDNDPLAPPVAAKNAELNGVASSCDFTDTPLAELCQTKYDLILANIIAPVILELLPEMLLRLSPGGRMLFSGLIERSIGAVEDALRQNGFIDITRMQQGDWFVLAAIHNP